MDNERISEFVEILENNLKTKPGIQSNNDYFRFIGKFNRDSGYNILVLDPDTLNIVNRFQSARDAAKHYNVSVTTVYQALSGKVKTAVGFFWITTAEYIQIGTDKFRNFKRVDHPNHSYISSKVYELIGRDADTGKILVSFDTFVKAAEAGFDRSSIHKCLRGKSSIYKSMKWEKVYKNINPQTP